MFADLAHANLVAAIPGGNHRNTRLRHVIEQGLYTGASQAIVDPLIE